MAGPRPLARADPGSFSQETLRCLPATLAEFYLPLEPFCGHSETRSAVRQHPVETPKSLAWDFITLLLAEEE